MNSKQWPKISVVTPSLNQAQYIETCMLSVLNQNYPNLEYIIVDGGSSDGTTEIIEKYQARLHYWCSEKDGGHANALNKGFAESTGEIMCWINSDDFLMPNSLYVASEVFLQYEDVNWILGLTTFANQNGTVLSTEVMNFNIFDFLRWRFQYIQQESVFWRRSLWKLAGSKIDNSYRLAVDAELWCRFFAFSELVTVHAALGCWRRTDANRSIQHREEYLQEMIQAISTLEAIAPNQILKSAKLLRYVDKIRGLNLPILTSVLTNNKSLLAALGKSLEIAPYSYIDWDSTNSQWRKLTTTYRI